MKVNISNFKYYSKIFGKYNVVKSTDGKMKYFGRYDTEEEAQARVEFLKKHNWDPKYAQKTYNRIKEDPDIHENIRKGFFVSKKNKKQNIL